MGTRIRRVIPFERDPKRDPGREPRHGFDRRGREQFERADLARRTLDASADASRNAGSSRAAWLIGPLLLCSIGAAIAFVMRGPDQVFGVAFGLVLALGLVWILISALFPASADRRCPQCGRATVIRIDVRVLTGLRCRSCSWRDESASAFVHAEDDGEPFEDAVLRERGRFRRF
jgi:ribosomal protein L37AE/L43A